MAAIDVSTKTAISIHALREEGDLQPVLRPGCIRIISIHALREEGDSSYKDSSIHTYLFQSTPSARRATGDTLNNEEAKGYFNPRPPRGGRPWGR